MIRRIILALKYIFYKELPSKRIERQKNGLIATFYPVCDCMSYIATFTVEKEKLKTEWIFNVKYEAGRFQCHGLVEV